MFFCIKKDYSLLKALDLGDIQKANLLIEKKINLDLTDKEEGETALIKSIKYKYYDFAKKLIKKKVNLNTEDKDGWTAIFWTVENNEYSLLNLLVDNGADINHKNIDGWTPLFLAVNNNNIEMTKNLLSLGANPDIVDKENKTPLIWAIQNRFTNIAKMLIPKTNLNIIDSDGNSALHYAVLKEEIEIIKNLLKYGANSELKNNEGLTPNQLAEKKHINLKEL